MAKDIWATDAFKHFLRQILNSRLRVSGAKPRDLFRIGTSERCCQINSLVSVVVAGAVVEADGDGRAAACGGRGGEAGRVVVPLQAVKKEKGNVF